MLLNGTNFILRCMARCRSTPRIFNAKNGYSGNELGRLKGGRHRQQEELVTLTNCPGEIWSKIFGKQSQNILILWIPYATKAIDHAGASNVSRYPGFALGVKRFIPRRDWRRARAVEAINMGEHMCLTKERWTCKIRAILAYAIG